MTSLQIPPIEWIDAPAPDRQPLAHFTRSRDHVELGLAGNGTIRVRPNGIEVLAPDEVSRQRTLDRLGEWGRAQWLASQGFAVVRGSCVASEGRALVLFGAARSGASVLAFIMSRRGWGLVSDGLVVIDRRGFARAWEPEVTLDEEAISGLPADVPRTSLSTGRARVRVPTASHPDAPVHGYVFLKVKHSAAEMEFASIPFDATTAAVIEKCTMSPILGYPESRATIPPADFWSLTRPTFLLDPDSYSPPALATLLMSRCAQGGGA